MAIQDQQATTPSQQDHFCPGSTLPPGFTLLLSPLRRIYRRHDGAGEADLETKVLTLDAG